MSRACSSVTMIAVIVITILSAVAGYAQPTKRDGCFIGDPDAYQSRLMNSPSSILNKVRNGTAGSRAAASGPTVIAVPVLAGKYADTGSDPFPPSALQASLYGTGPYGVNITDYYSEVSYDSLLMTGQVYGLPGDALFQAPGNEADYTPTDATVRQYVTDIIQAADANVDFAQYDNDGPDGIPHSGDDDGYLDSWVAVSYPTRDFNCNGGMKGRFGTLTPPVTVDGVTIRDFCVCPMLACDDSQVRIATVGVWCHEYGHGLGLDDLYKNQFLATFHPGIGYWGLMGEGAFGALGEAGGYPPINSHDNPNHMSPRNKEWLGWVEPDSVISSTQGYRLYPVETTGDVMKLCIPGSDCDDEYFLLEFRSNSAGLFDTSLPTSGLVVWRVTRGLDCPDGGSGDCDGVYNSFDIGQEVITAGLPMGAIYNSWGDATNVFPGPLGMTEVDDSYNGCLAPHRRLTNSLGEPTGLALNNIHLAPDGSYVEFDVAINPPSPRPFELVQSQDLGRRARMVTWSDVSSDDYPDLYTLTAADPDSGCLVACPKCLPHAPAANTLSNNLYFGSAAGLAYGGSGLEWNADCWGGVTADFNNDAHPDIAVAARECDNIKSKILRGTGCTGPGACTFSGSTVDGDLRSAVATDLDGDGWAEVLFVGVAGDWKCYESNGGTTFSPRQIQIPAQVDARWATFFDYDNDGDQDLLLFGMVSGVMLYENDGGVLSDVTSSKIPYVGTYTFLSGATFDFDRDGDLDALIGNTAGTFLLRNGGAGNGYAFSTTSVGITASSPIQAIVPFDYDNDGWEDVLTCTTDNGSPLWHNNGENGTFSEAWVNLELNCSHSYSSYRAGHSAAAAADFDLDGDLDIVALLGEDDTNNNLSDMSMELFANNAAGSNHWLEVQLVGMGEGHSNHSAIGARVHVDAGGESQMREISGGTGSGQNWLTAHFGLGTASSAALTINWPSGLVQTFTSVGADQRVVIHEPFHGTITNDTTWRGSIYLDGDVLVDENATLTIAPGTEVTFALTDAANLFPLFEDRVELHVAGHLQVNGTDTEPVDFHSVSESPTSSDWVMIQVSTPGSITMDYANVRDCEWGLSCSTTGAIAASHCSFSNNASRGIMIYNDDASATIDYCDVEVSTGVGIDLHCSRATVSNSVVVGPSALTGSGIEVVEGDMGLTPDITFTNNVINDFQYGARLHGGTSLWTGNHVSNCQDGIFAQRGVHTVGQLNAGNTFTGNTTGLWVYNQAPGNCPTYTLTIVARNNTFDENNYHVVAEKTADADLGTTVDPGNNAFLTDTTSCVWNNSICGTVSAVGNYWDNGCVAPTCVEGDVDASDPLCTPPQPVVAEQKPEPDPELPTRTALIGNTPNPFNPTTEIRFSLVKAADVSLAIYDVQGRRVVSEKMSGLSAGVHGWIWKGRDAQGRVVSSGVYFVVLEAGSVRDTRKIVMLK